MGINGIFLIIGVMQDLYHQPYERFRGGLIRVGGERREVLKPEDVWVLSVPVLRLYIRPPIF